MRLGISLLITIAIAAQATLANGETIIPGGNVSGTWTAAGSPYIVQGLITIPADATLNIEPGVEIDFPGAGLTVNGYLQAFGTEADSISFSSTSTWVGISFESAPDSSHLEYCIVTGADNDWAVGIRCSYSSPVISHCRISDNGGMDYGGIYLDHSHPSISRCMINGNSNFSHGGGIRCSNSNPVISHCIVSGNSSNYRGGGIFVASGSNPTISNSTISDNQADDGGGIYFEDAGGGTITGCTITDNEAEGRGGGIYFHAPFSSFTLTNTTIGHNTSYEGWGGGVYLYSARNVSFTSCTLDDNKAYGIGGGGMYVGNCDTLLIDHCDVLNNADSIWNSGILIDAGNVNLTLVNSVFKGQDVVDLSFDSYTSASVSYCDFDNQVGIPFSDPPPGLGTLTQTNANGDSCDVYFNIYEDPLFMDFENGDYSLTGNSPCIDAGDPDSPFDPDDTICDIGVYYYDQTIIGVEDSLDYPSANRLLRNSPNPFNPQTTITFSLERDEWAEVGIYELTGKRVAVLANRNFTGGEHSLLWNGRDAAGRSMPSGSYIVRLETETGVEASKISLIR